jgi:hypothetical protein
MADSGAPVEAFGHLLNAISPMGRAVATGV